MKKLLNSYKMNDALSILKDATQKEERSHFAIQCDNCTLSIVAGNPVVNNKEFIEIALRNVDDSTWIELEMEGYTEERPIMYGFPLIAFPALVRQFAKLKKEDFAEVWDAWDTITCYM